MARRLENVEKSMKRSNDKKLKVEHELWLKVKSWLEEEKDVRLGIWKAAEIEILNYFSIADSQTCGLLGNDYKNILIFRLEICLYVNVSERDYQRKKNNFLPKIHAWYGAGAWGENMIPFSCVLERNLADMPPDEAAKYCMEKELQRLVQYGASYGEIVIVYGKCYFNGHRWLFK
ncbi:hypothetical protein AG4045_025049 [Apium graveolens]|uniref:Uncharacterized protein n=1 Tax=Apium graveolens TaxID=4045 RepID=A0A6L5BBQ5_APIGR|nr:hypothetical protein AG4045_025049 [Apium graveolens]